MIRRRLRVVAIAVVLTVTVRGLAAAGCELVCDGVVSPSALSSAPDAAGSKCHGAGSLQHDDVLSASGSGCLHVLADAATTGDRGSTSAHAQMRNAVAPGARDVELDRSNQRSLHTPTPPPGRAACATSPLRL